MSGFSQERLLRTELITMDLHVSWLRRRILTSIASQSALTFAVAAVAVFTLMKTGTSSGVVGAIVVSIFVGLFVVVARVVHSMQAGPQSYAAMRHHTTRPFSYGVTRFKSDADVHVAAQQLVGFVPAATIRDPQAHPEPVFDIYHDPSGRIAAAVHRSSGAVSLLSSLEHGRILVTAVRAMSPHEQLVMNLSKDPSVEHLLGTHRDAIAARPDVIMLTPSPHQVVINAIAGERDSYKELGPELTSLLELEPGGTSLFRLIARVRPKELANLPFTLGHTKTSAPAVRATPAQIQTEARTSEASDIVAPVVISIEVAGAEITEPIMAPVDVTMPRVVTQTPEQDGVAVAAAAAVELDPAAEPLPLRIVEQQSELLGAGEALPTRAVQEHLGRPATLAEAIQTAPDSPAVLVDGAIGDFSAGYEGAAEDEPKGRPRLSEVLRGAAE